MAKKGIRRRSRIQAQKVSEALEIISAVGMPVGGMSPRRKERIALALLAAANITPESRWSEASCWEGKGSWSLGTREMIKFWNKHYGERVSSGSYDDVRRKDLVYLVEGRLVLRSAADPDASTNNPQRRYAVSAEWVDVLRTFGQQKVWLRMVAAFRDATGTLADRIERRRQQRKIPVRLPSGNSLELSFGAHNELQKAVVEEFLPRFAPGAEILYIGDTSKKSLLLEEARLKELGFFELAHNALPDIVAYGAAHNWLFLIEAVHSSNPISKLRHLMLERMTEKCAAPRIYISAFRDRLSFRNWMMEISWETEVWLADSPDHLVHFNGEQFFGAYAAMTAEKWKGGQKIG
jgi:hypothetical protein